MTVVADTKQRILDVAEQLFADNGFAGTSLRRIIAAAEVNLAAVHYHFRSKESLLEAVLMRRMVPLNDERLALLNQLEQEARGEGAELRSDHAVAVRGAQGVLISAAARQKASGKQLARSELIGLVEALHGVQQQLSELSATHHADDTDDKELKQLLGYLQQWEIGSNTESSGAGTGGSAVLPSGTRARAPSRAGSSPSRCSTSRSAKPATTLAASR